MAWRQTGDCHVEDIIRGTYVNVLHQQIGDSRTHKSLITTKQEHGHGMTLTHCIE